MNKTEWGGPAFVVLLLVFITSAIFVSEATSPNDAEQAQVSTQQTSRAGQSAGQRPLGRQHPAGKEKSTQSIGDAWDTVFADQPTTPDPSLIPQTPVSTGGNFAERFFFHYAVEYRREEISYTGRPTVTNVINGPSIADPTLGSFADFPTAFQPNDGKMYSDISFGTRSFAAERFNFYFSMRYRQDINGTTLGSPFAGILDTFRARRRAELYNGYVEVNRLGSSGLWSQTGLRFGRQSFFGAEPVDLDGATLIFNNTRYDMSVFAGRRFTYWADPFSRFIAGADFGFKFSPSARFRYQHTYYVRNTHRFSYQHTYRAWTFDTFFKMLNSHPIDFSAGINYAAPSGNHWVYANFFQKITNRDFFFDFVDPARSRDQNRPQFFVAQFLDDRNRLGTIPKYSQFYVEAHRKLHALVGIGGTFWLRRLNDAREQTAFLNSFEEATIRLQISPFKSFEVLPQYRFRNVRRRNPNERSLCREDPPVTTFVTTGPCHDDISRIGERRFHEILADTSFVVSPKISFGVGGFFRSYATQGSFRRFDPSVDEREVFNPTTRRTTVEITRTTFGIRSQNTGGILAHIRYRLDLHSSIRLEYGNDKDFSLFYPDINRVQAFRVRYEYIR